MLSSVVCRCPFRLMRHYFLGRWICRLVSERLRLVWHLRLQCTCCTVPTTSGTPHGSPLVWACQWPSPLPLSSQLSQNDNLWAYGITKSHREQVLFNREGEKLSWCASWSNSLCQRWTCGLVLCPGWNAIDPIWRVLASSEGISSWTPLKPQHSNPNPLPNQLWSIYFLTPATRLIIPHRLPVFLESLMLLKNWCSIHARWSKSSLKHSIRFCGIFFSSLKQNFIAYRSSKLSSRPDCIFEIHQPWQSGFSSVYSNCCRSCSFEPEIINIVQWSHKMYSNNIVNFQESTTILNACTKKSGNLLNAPRSLRSLYRRHPWCKRSRRSLLQGRQQMIWEILLGLITWLSSKVK